MKKLTEELSSLGLSPNEASIYLAALELGETTISRLVQKSGVKRSTVYLGIEGLKKKNLIAPLKKNGHIFYTAEDPRHLEHYEKERMEKTRELMPALLAITNVIDRKPGVRFYEGEEGIKEAFKDILKYPDSEVLEWYSESYITEFDEKFFSGYFTPGRVKNRISVRAIVPDDELIKKHVVSKNSTQPRQTKLIPKDKYKMRMELNIYGENKVSIMSFREEFALIIEGEIIHQSPKTIFEMAWE